MKVTLQSSFICGSVRFLNETSKCNGDRMMAGQNILKEEGLGEHKRMSWIFVLMLVTIAFFIGIWMVVMIGMFQIPSVKFKPQTILNQKQ